MHPFFSDINWDTIATEYGPFIPVCKDYETIYFPKSAEIDPEDPEVCAIVKD